MTGSTENVWDRISRCIPARFRRSVIAPHFLEQLKKSQTVAGGPFKGMRYHGEAVCGAAAPKIMGIYEAELAPFLLKWSAVPFQHIINVGAGEGYYAVGCAMLWPQATVTAFESSEEGRRLLARNVDLNHLQSRVKILGHCEEEQLRAAPFNGQPSLVIIDTEGAEGELLGRANLPGLENAHVIVEIHDFVDNRLGELISLRLTSTHAIQEVRTRPRTFWDFHEPRALWLRLWLLPYLKQYSNELRPGPMRWFCCTPVTRSHVINAQPCSYGVGRRPVPVAAKEVSVPATRCLLSAKGAVSIQSPGHRPRDEIQIRTSTESASSSPQSETVPLRPITTTDIVETRLQRSLNADSTHGASPQAAIEAAPSALNTYKGRGYTARSTLSVQRKALARKFAPGLLRPFTGMNVSVRFGEIAQTILSHWPIPSQPAKPIARFRYLTVSDRRHWLILRESLFSLYQLMELFAGDCRRVRRKLDGRRLFRGFRLVACADQRPAAARNLRGRFVRWFSRIGRLCTRKSLRSEARGDCNASKEAADAIRGCRYSLVQRSGVAFGRPGIVGKTARVTGE